MRTISPLPCHRRSRRVRLSLSVALLAVAALLSSASAAQELQQSRRPQFGAAVARVRVDVIVTDEGDFVDDLLPGDFVLHEDGVEQPILSVQLVDLLPDAGASPVSLVLQDESTTGAAAAAERPAARAQTGPEPEAPQDLAGVVYAVDALTGALRGNSRFARGWGATLQDIDTVPVPQAVYLVDCLGYPHELVPFTQDAAALRAAVERVRGKELYGGEPDPVWQSIAGCSHFGPPYDEAFWLAEKTYAFLTAITDMLAERPGRKALIWVGQDFQVLLPDSPSTAGRRTGEQAGALAELGFDPFGFGAVERSQSAFARAANSAGVSVYGIDPDLVTWHNPIGSVTSSKGPVDRILARPFAGSFSAAPNALDDVSNATGGRAYIRWGNIPDVLSRIERETARFYLITYAPPDPPDDGDYHEIRVAVRRDGLAVRARDGYYDIGDAERAQRAEDARRLLRAPAPWGESGNR